MGPGQRAYQSGAAYFTHLTANSCLSRVNRPAPARPLVTPQRPHACPRPDAPRSGQRIAAVIWLLWRGPAWRASGGRGGCEGQRGWRVVSRAVAAGAYALTGWCQRRCMSAEPACCAFLGVRKRGGAASSSARRCCRAIASGAAAVLLHRQPNSDSAASTRWGVSARTRADLWHLARLKWTTS